MHCYFTEIVLWKESLVELFANIWEPLFWLSYSIPQPLKQGILNGPLWSLPASLTVRQRGRAWDHRSQWGTYDPSPSPSLLAWENLVCSRARVIWTNLAHPRTMYQFVLMLRRLRNINDNVYIFLGYWHIFTYPQITIYDFFFFFFLKWLMMSINPQLQRVSRNTSSTIRSALY